MKLSDKDIGALAELVAENISFSLERGWTDKGELWWVSIPGLFEGQGKTMSLAISRAFKARALALCK